MALSAPRRDAPATAGSPTRRADAGALGAAGRGDAPGPGTNGVGDPALPRQLNDRSRAIYAVMAVFVAAIALVGDEAGVAQVVYLTLSIAPFLVEAAGVRVPQPLFVAWVLVPVGVLVALQLAPGALLLPAILACRITSTTRSRVLVVASVAGGVALAMLSSYQHGSTDQGDIYFAAGVLFGWFAGVLLRRQSELVRELAQAQAALGARAAEQERQRIARDIHDIVAHSLTVVMLNVTGARKAMRQDPGKADEALARAEQIGRESLDGIRQAVGLLRDAGDDTRASVTPSADAIPALVDGYRRSGLTVVLQVTGDMTRLDAASGAACYRLVQESLANVLSHAPGATAGVRIEAGRRAIKVAIENGPPAPGHAPLARERSGFGLAGHTERIGALGGRVTAGPHGAGWIVTATIPTHRRFLF